MSRTRRWHGHRPELAPAKALQWIFCETHGKRAYFGRKKAKKAIKVANEPRLREYPCGTWPGRWHIGHLAPDIVKGEITAPEIYGWRRAT